MRYNNSPESENKNLINLSRASRMPNSLKNENIFDLEGIFKKFENFNREISRIFEDLFDNIPGVAEINDIKVVQTDENVIINAKIPGLSTDNLDINIGEDYIRLSGKQQKSSEYRNSDNNLYSAQKFCSAFFRTIPLPVKVKYDLAKVEYNGDALSISIPKLRS